MSISLKDQLLGLGFTQPVQKPVVQKKHPGLPSGDRRGNPTVKAKSGIQTGRRSASKPAQSQTEIDLAKAFALRSQQDKREREAAEAAKQEAARQKRLAKEQVAALLEGKILNLADADIARHFSYSGKIKRIYVNAGQLTALNSGALGVVQFNGRFCLVDKDVALAVRAQLPALLALYCDGTEINVPEHYDDPKFQVPDDLIW
jgi:uncharacterized protein YaiL (DUF2058 family)